MREAHGDVLLAGLGIGMLALACAQKENVNSVTVLEKAAQTIALNRSWHWKPA